MSTFVKHLGAIYTPTVEQLPLYTENEEGLPRYTEDDEDQEHPEREDGQDRIQLFLNGLLSSPDESQLDPHIIKDLLQDEHRRLSDIVSSRAQFEIYRGELATDELSFIALAITRLLFRSISAGKSETISWLISQNLVSPNVIDTDGMSPLLAAVKAGRTRTIQELVDLGAEPDAYAISGFRLLPVGRAAIRRTPLQLAAELGNLPLVKMFIETYQCDDSKVAPDGELALRLASKNGHRHVVDYLPARRGGGWKRWRTAHEVSMAKARDALKSIFEFTVFFVYKIPKFFLWTIPKKGIVEPLMSGCKWCWVNKAGLLPWIKYQAQQTPARIKKCLQSLWKVAKRTPKDIADVSKDLWKFCTRTLPKHIWRVLTVEMPKIVKSVSKWVWSILSSIATTIANLFQRIASLVHTIITAIASFFRTLTLSDIWNGFCDVLRVVFISFPLKVYDIVLDLGELTYKAMGALFGLTGKVLWYIGFALLFLVTYIPKQIWAIVRSMGVSIATGYKEIRVWVNPKA
ncbi:ankyrin repeat domain-containing protein, conidia-enriched transcript [Histoplasma ohiense]|nr:ankyrin repeat domain-containing protein, conidia-enriched transcript [Histoplasma ohiense (nom. inval.)]